MLRQHVNCSILFLVQEVLLGSAQLTEREFQYPIRGSALLTLAVLVTYMRSDH
jgi:hypothetical protein